MSKRIGTAPSSKNIDFNTLSESISRAFFEKYKNEFQLFPKVIRTYLNCLAGSGVLKKRAQKDISRSNQESDFNDFAEGSISVSVKTNTRKDITELLDNRKGLVGDLQALLKHLENDAVNDSKLVSAAKDSINSLIELIQDRRRNLEKAVALDVEPVLQQVAIDVAEVVENVDNLVPAAVEFDIHTAPTADHPVVLDVAHLKTTAPHEIVQGKLVEVSDLQTRVTAPYEVVPDFVRKAVSTPVDGSQVVSDVRTSADSADYEIIAEDDLNDFIERVESGQILPTSNDSNSISKEKSPEDTDPPKDFD